MIPIYNDPVSGRYGKILNLKKKYLRYDKDARLRYF